MKLYYWRPPTGNWLATNGSSNFGDDLNPWLWEKLGVSFLNEDRSKAFVGIGTLLNCFLDERTPGAQEYHIFGTGVGLNPKPLVLDSRHRVHGVRGFLSARTLGLPDEKALTDPAVLLRRVYRPSGVKKFRRAYMPWFLHANPTLERVCREAGFGYIDPGGKVEQVLDQITGTEVLFTEAMHGAIVADALRVPWVPVVTQALVEPYKWQDWLSVLGMEYEPHRVGWLPLRPGRRDFWKYGRRIQNAVSVRTVGFSLQRLARKAKPRLSREGLVEDLTQRLEEKLAHLSAYTNC